MQFLCLYSLTGSLPMPFNNTCNILRSVLGSLQLGCSTVTLVYAASLGKNSWEAFSGLEMY